MKFFTSKKLAYLVAASLTGALVGCDGDDGKDGVDGSDGGYTVPAVTSSTETNVNVINYTLGEGQISYEVEITDENGAPINGLVNFQAKVAALTDKGYIANRDETIEGVEDTVNIGGAKDQGTEGAEVVQIDDGHYTLTVPMAGVNAGTEGIVWLRVGGNSDTGIARSEPLVVNKPEGAFSTTTEACFSCHVDYSTSPRRHASYTAQDMDGEIDFVAGCLVCHGSVSRAAKNEEGLSIGGYATNTLSAIGHINHQEFTKNFSVMNCSTCHATETVNTNVTGPGCIDCHATGGVPGDIISNPGSDFRALHETKAGLTELKDIRAKYEVTLSTPIRVTDISTLTDHYADATAATLAEAGFCTTLTVTDTTDGSILNIGENFNYTAETTGHDASKPITYAGAYLHSYSNHGLVGRPGARNGYYYGYNDDGTKTFCYPDSKITAVDAGYVYSVRVAFSTEGWTYYDGKVRGQTNDRIRANGYDGTGGVSITAYSDVVDSTTGEKVSGWDRRVVVKSDSCTTCHNDATEFHKHGAFDNGGEACIACHGNGMNRTTAEYGAGFGPMVHSWHWGNGAKVGEVELGEDGTWVQTGEANGAAAIAPQTSCAACHDGSVSLSAVPAQYISEPSSNMSSPVTANCYACHNDASAKAHMEQNGGEISIAHDAHSADDWFKQVPAESCATCHDTGSSFGVEKYHNFTR